MFSVSILCLHSFLKRQQILHLVRCRRTHLVHSDWPGWLGWVCSLYVVCTVFSKINKWPSYRLFSQNMLSISSVLEKHIWCIPSGRAGWACSHYFEFFIFVETYILKWRMKLNRLYQPFRPHPATTYKTKCSNAWDGRVSEGEGEKGWRRERVERGLLLCNIFHILSYTFIYFHIPLYTPKCRYVPSYTPIYFEVSNIDKMWINMRPTNGHISGPRGFPKVRIWPKAF